MSRTARRWTLIISAYWMFYGVWMVYRGKFNQGGTGSVVLGCCFLLLALGQGWYTYRQTPDQPSDQDQGQQDEDQDHRPPTADTNP
jgi:hypothetical protein